MGEIERQDSALHENINRKGSNSYYYAHGNTATGPAWDGKEAPRLLATETAPQASEKKIPIKQFDSYSWLDEEKSVKIYVDYEGACDVLDENISLMAEDTSAEFSVVVGDHQLCLNLSPLNDSISSASFKKKSDKFVLTLKKSEEGSWTSLKKTS